MEPSTQTSNFDDPALATQAANLTKAIFQQESGSDYNATGDAGTSKGAGQWQPETWKAQAQDVLGDANAPMTRENQNVVAQGTIRKLISQGKNAAQIAAIWNSGSDENWQNKVGTTMINGQQVKYNVPHYVKSVTDLYQQYKNQSGSLPQAPSGNLASASAGGYQPPLPPGQSQGKQSGNAAGYAPPTPPTQPTTTTQAGDTSDPSGGFLQGLQEDLQGTNPNPIGTQIGNAITGAGNFLFPAVGDIYNDLTGKNQKTALQQAGDVGLSILPFIPGLGEYGEGARAVAGGAELAGSAADAAKAGGLLSKAAALPTALKGAAAGYGAGVASNLSQGQSLGQAVTPNAATLGGAVLGGTAPIALKGLGGVATKVSGISPQIETKLTQLGVEADPENATLYDKYMQAAKEHATNGEVPAPENMAADNIDQASAKIDQMASQAGKEVGLANKAAANIPIDPKTIPSLATSLNEKLDSFGYKVGTKDDGTLALVPTRTGGVPLTSSEQARVLDVALRINDMGNQGNVRMADDLMTILDKKHDYGATGQDPLTGIFGQVRHDVNEIARTASPEFAAANDKLSGLRNLQDTIKIIAGNRLQRGELLMQRMFGKNPGDSQALFKAIRDATGVDLYKHAVLARHAIESVGSKADKSALQQMIEGSTKGHVGLLGAAANIAGGAAKKTFANPETIGRNLIKGKKSGLMGELVTKGAIRTGTSL